MRWQPKDPLRWHRWFAWRPVRMDGGYVIVWLEMVERKLYSHYPDSATYSYRFIPRETP